EIPNENTGERYGVSRNSMVFVAECGAVPPRQQPLDRFPIQLGNRKQDRGAGVFEVAFRGGEATLGDWAARAYAYAF
ncbi:MAG: hypothetical protein ABSG62_23500, partial [Terracidiphilus sp.]